MKHTTGEVREETKELIIEIYRWTGPDIKSHLTDLKPSQVMLEQTFPAVRICLETRFGMARPYAKSEELELCENQSAVFKFGTSLL